MQKIQSLQASWLHSTTAALLTAAAGFVCFGVLFRYEPPKIVPAVHRTGRASLLTLRGEDEVMRRWLTIHDPSRIAFGTPPEIRMHACPLPPSVKPDPLVELTSPELPREAVPFAAGTDHGDSYIPDFHTSLPAPVFPVLPRESFPKFTVNGIREKLILPESLLKLAASVNAGTVEMRIGRGFLPEERRVEVLRSSGSARVDQLLSDIFSARKYRELPARLQLVWESTGEKVP